MTEAEAQQWEQLSRRVTRYFTPTTPIDAAELFAGRDHEVRQIVDVINETGQHAILYGERGVGKTSLANVLSDLLPTAEVPTKKVLSPRVQCDGGDNFKTVWKKVFDTIELSRKVDALGFGGQGQVETYSSIELLGGDKITPDAVRGILAIMSKTTIPIIIVDEFDRLRQEARRNFADLIKNLSDNAVPATVILVGVADSIQNLLAEHRSVSRCLVQVHMPRMNDEEIRQIIDKGTKKLKMTITTAAIDRIAKLAQGLPHYAHALGKHATRAAITHRSMTVGLEDVNEAVRKAIDDANQSIKIAYAAAIRSVKKKHLFAEVLLACALAETDGLGFFAAQDVVEPFQQITGKNYRSPAFAQHLSEFSSEKRGHILVKTGKPYGFFYRFSEPLMKPYVIMQGMSCEMLPDSFLPNNSSDDPSSSTEQPQLP